MIRDEDQVRELWQQAIPDQYRISDKTLRRDRLGRPIHSEASAIIPPPPPQPLLDRSASLPNLSEEKIRGCQIYPPSPPPPLKRRYNRARNTSSPPPPPIPAEGMSECEFRKTMAEFDLGCGITLVPTFRQ
jgi:hypothetical protein